MCGQQQSSTEKIYTSRDQCKRDVLRAMTEKPSRIREFGKQRPIELWIDVILQYNLFLFPLNFTSFITGRTDGLFPNSRPTLVGAEQPADTPSSQAFRLFWRRTGVSLCPYFHVPIRNDFLQMQRICVASHYTLTTSGMVSGTVRALILSRFGQKKMKKRFERYGQKGIKIKKYIKRVMLWAQCFI